MIIHNNPQYCPECFGNTMRLKKSGVFEVVINSIPMDAGKILFQLDKEDALVKEDLKEKIKYFFQYYSRFTNKKPIHSIKLFSRDFICTNNCRVTKYQFSVVNVLMTAKEVMEILKETSEKYPLQIELTEKEIT